MSMLTREIAKKVCNTQLEGIMFHAEMVDFFLALRQEKMLKCHERQLKEELCTMLATKKYLNGIFGEAIIATATATRPKLPDIPKDANMEAVAYELTTKAIVAWYAWEETVCEVYAQALTEDDCRFWRRLAADVGREIAKIKRVMQAGTGDGYPLLSPF